MTNMQPTGRATSRNREPRPPPWGEGGTEAWGNKADRQAAAPSSHTLLKQEGPQHLTGGSGDSESHLQGFKSIPVCSPHPCRENGSLQRAHSPPDAWGTISTWPQEHWAITWIGCHLGHLSPGSTEKGQQTTTSVYRAQPLHSSRPRTTTQPGDG